jgi:hypothetical protein
MSTRCDSCDLEGPLSLCADCADKLRKELTNAEIGRDKAEDKRDRAINDWHDAFEEAVKNCFAKKPEELTVSDLAAPWGKWVKPLLEVWAGGK